MNLLTSVNTTALAELLAKGILVVGILALVVTVITQVTKKLPYLSSIPTDIEVFVLSLVLTVTALVIYSQIIGFTLLWYYIVGAIVLSFFVSYIAIFGWRSFYELYNRLVKDGKDE